MGRRWLWVAAVLAAALVGTGAGLLVFELHRPAAQAAGATPPPASFQAGTRRAPAFRLVDENGRPLTLAQFRGRPVIVTFIDPLCRNYCPLEAQQLNALVHRLPARSRPAIVAVSVNVDGNARANLREDAAKWRLVPEWHWGVGTHAQLAPVWREYGIGVSVATRKIAGVTVHDVTHTEAAYVIDAKGFERALFLWPFSAGDVQAALSAS